MHPPGVGAFMRHGRGWQSLIAAVLGFSAVASLLASSARASATPSASVQETINVAVRSLTVSPSSVSVCSTQSPLTFPNGSCSTPTITITNGAAGGHIDIAGTNAVPSDQTGTSWALCVELTSCTGSNGYPGADQYREYNLVNPGAGTAYQGLDLTTAGACDEVFDEPSGFACSSSPGQTATEFVNLMGPASSTDQSPTFSASITWTAVP
jgi:hypothetical protein